MTRIRWVIGSTSVREEAIVARIPADILLHGCQSSKPEPRQQPEHSRTFLATMHASMITVFLADDHETVREGLRLLINAQPDMEVISEAGDGITAVERACESHPQVIVL